MRVYTYMYISPTMHFICNSHQSEVPNQIRQKGAHYQKGGVAMGVGGCCTEVSSVSVGGVEWLPPAGRVVR